MDHFVDSIHARGLPGRPPSAPPTELVSKLPAVERLVAIGDLHGDFDKTKRAFQLAGLTDANHRWIGGTSVCVQVGDQLDRGDHEIPIVYFLERLQQEASESGGALFVMNGNHETINIAGRFRYSTPKALMQFARWNIVQSVGESLKRRCNCPPGLSEAGNTDGFPSRYTPVSGSMARWAALRTGGPFTKRFMARHQTILQIGSTVFVHGGILPQHLEEGPDAINRGTQKWMLGELQTPPSYLTGRNAVVWTRQYSMEDPDDCDCDKLQDVLKQIPEASRMIVGHTIQAQGINSACDGRVIRIDVGMSKGCGNGDVQVLEILKDQEIRILQFDRNGRTQVHDVKQTNWAFQTMFT